MGTQTRELGIGLLLLCKQRVEVGQAAKAGGQCSHLLHELFMPFRSISHDIKLLGTDHPIWDWSSPESGVTQFRVQDNFSSPFPKFPTQQSGRPNLREAKTPR